MEVMRLRTGDSQEKMICCFIYFLLCIDNYYAYLILLFSNNIKKLKILTYIY